MDRSVNLTDSILVFTANIDKWGAERSVTSMCAGLQAKGFNVVVIIPRMGEIHQLLDAVNVKYLVFDYPMAIKDKYSIVPLWRRIAQKRHFIPEYLRLHKQLKELSHVLMDLNINPIAVYSATLTIDFGCRYASIHGYTHIQHIRENLDAFGYTYKYGLNRGLTRISQNSKLIICTCKAIYDKYKTVLDSSIMRIVNNGVPVNPIVEQKRPTDKLYILQTTRLMQDKNVMDSLKAINVLVNKGYTSLKLDIYGIGDQQSFLQNYIDNYNLNDYVKLKGFCDNIDYSKYHVGLMTSIFEAFSRSTIEYMNNSLAVIVSRAGGNTEQVKDGYNGLLYELYNSEDLASKILKYYQDRSYMNDIAQTGRKYFIDNYTQDIYVSKITTIIANCIKER